MVKQATNDGQQLSRRRLLKVGTAGGIAMMAATCGSGQIGERSSMSRNKQQRSATPPATAGRLQAPPTQEQPHGQTQAAPLGMQPLELGAKRDGLLYVPAGYQPEHPTPLVLMLHGAGGNAQHGLAPLLDFADTTGLILLAPDSRGRTWDIILDEYGPDIRFIEQALRRTFTRYAVDPTHIAVGGFSDGASYALSVGVTNGDLFTHVIAFSPGFMAPADQQGEPDIFISHGIHDTVLPIDRCSRRIVPQLQRAGYDVRYHEFDGPHTVPSAIAREAVDWFIV